MEAFVRAASQWEQALFDPISVELDASLTSFGGPVPLGGASAVLLSAEYGLVRDRMVLDHAADSGAGYVGNLPSAADLSLVLPPGSSWTGELFATKANLKALGFGGLDQSFGTLDGQILLNSDVAFDFDSRDGIGAGLVDFESVVAHEIGHVLGFVSVVDEIDGLLAAGLSGPVSMTPLDLFRFEEGQLPRDAAEFSTLPRDLVPGHATVFEDGVGPGLAFSSGIESGDGRQASHWRDDEVTGNRIGLMDPTFSPGQVIRVGSGDLRALDSIGWGLLPEPSTALLLTLGLGWLSVRRRGLR